MIYPRIRIYEYIGEAVLRKIVFGGCVGLMRGRGAGYDTIRRTGYGQAQYCA